MAKLRLILILVAQTIASWAAKIHSIASKILSFLLKPQEGDENGSTEDRR